MADKRRMIIERLWIMKKAAQEIQELQCTQRACDECPMTDTRVCSCAIENISEIEIPEE
jgi:uncharacterized protein YqkB